MNRSPRKKLLLIPAVALFIGLAVFWAWVESLRPALVQDRATYMGIFSELHAGKPSDILPESTRQRARRLGIDPTPEVHTMAGSGLKRADPNSRAVWLAAAQRTALAAWGERDRYERFHDWRIPIAVAVVSVALLLVVLAFSKPAESSAVSEETPAASTEHLS